MVKKHNELPFIEIKGRKGLLCLVVHDKKNEILQDLPKMIKETIDGSEVLKGQLPLVIDVGQIRLTRKIVLEIINEILPDNSLKLHSWAVSDPGTKSLLINMGFSVESISLENMENTQQERLPNTIFKNSIRSGEHIEAEGDVLVIGDLHPGAEITAKGNIFVTGRLQGIVHAGCDGSLDRYVGAGTFLAEQIRISNKVSITDREQQWWGQSVVVTVVEDGTFRICEINRR